MIIEFTSTGKAPVMSQDPSSEKAHPIDVVIAWVDGSDSRLTEKRNRYLGLAGDKANPGAHPTRFASINEIRYCVLSVFRFAPFVRNLYIVTDGQDPGLYDDIKTWFPERVDSVRIVDHTEIFEGFENYLPTFNSISIGNMIWRIKGLSDNFVYFNDDTFLIRNIRPEDFFIDNRPVLRGKWVPAPLPRILWNSVRKSFHKHFRNNPAFQPKASFHIGQWNSASLLGLKWRYFTNSHTPHTVGKKTVEDFASKNRPLLEKNISHRFRHHSQFTFISLSNHLQLLQGNRLIASPDLAYLQPYNRPKDYIDKKIRLCEKDSRIKFVCVQSLEMCGREEQEKLLGWMQRRLDLK